MILQTQLQEQLANLLSAPPKEIKLSELVEQFMEMHDGEPPSDRITLIVDYSETWHSGKWFDIYFDPQSEERKHNCEHMIRCKEDGTVWGMRIGGVDTDKRLFLGPMHGFDRTLFQMKVAGTKVIVDENYDDIDTTYPSYRD